jgi:uncharacterized oligopeptide transporter (OPT) family protein
MNDLLTTFTAATLVALIFALVKFAKNVMNLDLPESRNTVITQVCVWVIAFVVMLLGAQADIASSLVLVNHTPLSALDVPSLVLLALAFGSSASVLQEFKKARDNADSASDPALTRSDRP